MDAPRCPANAGIFNALRAAAATARTPALRTELTAALTQLMRWPAALSARPESLAVIFCQSDAAHAIAARELGLPAPPVEAPSAPPPLLLLLLLLLCSSSQPIQRVILLIGLSASRSARS
jgi:hypothetical protein